MCRDRLPASIQKTKHVIKVYFSIVCVELCRKANAFEPKLMIAASDRQILR